MAKYLELINGEITEKTPITASSGTLSALQLIQTDSEGKIHSTFLPTNIGAIVKTITPIEPLGAGDFVNIYRDDTNNIRVRKAYAAQIKPANGFVLTPATTGIPVLVYLSGVNNVLSGLSEGSDYFLSVDVSGKISPDTPPAQPSGSPAWILQKIGKAISTTELYFDPQPYVVRG